jgi:hypothetical protein
VVVATFHWESQEKCQVSYRYQNTPRSTHEEVTNVSNKFACIVVVAFSEVFVGLLKLKVVKFKSKAGYILNRIKVTN